MKKIKITLFFISLFLLSSAYAQDTIYVMRNGMAIFRCAVTDIDSISYENSSLNRTTVTDTIINNKSNSIFNQALIATGLVDSLSMDRDKTYFSSTFQSLITTPLASGSWFYQTVPSLRRYGFTILMESDSVFRLSNINNLDELKAYAASVYNAVYPQDAQVTNPKDRCNSLNRFVAYHLLNVKLKSADFIDNYVMYNGSFNSSHMLDIPGQLFHEYYSTLCPNTLMEITRKGGSSETNLINYNQTNNSAVHIIKTYSGSDSMNACIYGIDNILTFNNTVIQQLSSKRLRFDFASFFPELMNNGMRGQGSTEPNLQHLIPTGYLANIKSSKKPTISYLTPYKKIQTYEGDKIYVYNYPDKFDLSIESLPIPAGCYEVRIGISQSTNKALLSIGIDGSFSGLHDFNTNIYTPETGAERTGTNNADPNGYINDMVLRSHGVMKGPACFRVPVVGWSSGINARYSNSVYRKILGVYTFDTTKTHTIQFFTHTEGELELDYIEFIPVQLIDTEDIY